MKHFLRARDPRGFTLIEMIAALVIVAITVFIVISRLTSTSNIGRSAQESVIKNHIRYAQATAMKRNEIWGIKCDGVDYWLFRTNDPDTAANQIALPDEDNAKVRLANKNIIMTAFPTPSNAVFFDGNGRPYIDAAMNTPVSAANPLSITVDSIPASTAVAFGITPETGFIP